MEKTQVQIKVKEPAAKVDLNYLFKYSQRCSYEIPHFYDKTQWEIGHTYRMRIGNIYDPSKFWIVLKEQELTLFQNFLNNFYSENGEAYKIPSEKIKRNCYCVVFSDGAYYRGLIVNIPSFTSLIPKAIVFLFDFGFIAVVNFDNVYYLAEKMFDVPQFAIRACLYGVEPYEGENWCSQVVNRFHYLTNGKVLLCVLEATDPSRRIVYIRVSSNVDDYFQVKDIGEMLINEKLLRKATLKSDKYQGASKMVPKTKYPYLFPSFESIENGMMPSSVYINELLKHCITSIILFKPYFTYNGINLSD